MSINREKYYEKVRQHPFGGKLSQQQVDGQNFILDQWEEHRSELDRRWLAYALATTYHEVSGTMQPIEEYGKGQGQPYGEPDPVTGKAYYGRGYVQLTWADNYKKMTPIVQAECPEARDLYWYPEGALYPSYAAVVMFEGMERGMFRPPNKFETYFNDLREDPYTAREIVNGDKQVVPNWSSGVSIGNLISGYYADFMTALDYAWEEPLPQPEPEPVVSIRMLEAGVSKIAEFSYGENLMTVVEEVYIAMEKAK